MGHEGLGVWVEELARPQLQSHYCQEKVEAEAVVESWSFLK